MNRSEPRQAPSAAAQERRDGTADVQSRRWRLDVSLVRGHEQVEALHDEWNELFTVHGTNFLQSPDCAKSVVGASAGRVGLHILAFKARDTLVGVAPMLLRKSGPLGLSFRRECGFVSDVLGLPAVGPNDILVHPDFHKEVALAFSAYFVEHPRLFHRLVLRGIPPNSVVARYFPPLWDRLGVSYAMQDDTFLYRLPLSSVLDEFTAGFEGTTRNQISSLLGGTMSRPQLTAVGVLTTSNTAATAHSIARRRGPSLFGTRESTAGLAPKLESTMLRSFEEHGLLWNVTIETPNGGWSGCTVLIANGAASLMNHVRVGSHRSPGSLADMGILLSVVSEAVRRGAKELRFCGREEFFFQNSSLRRERLKKITTDLRFAGVTASDAEESSAALAVPVPVPAPPEVAEPTPYSVRVVSKESEFFALRTDWERLAGESSARIFQSFDWQWTWWRFFGKGRNLCILEVRHYQKLVGLLPLFREESKFAGLRLPARLRFIGAPVAEDATWGPKAGIGFCDYLDLVVHPGHAEGVARALTEYFRTNSGSIDEIVFDSVPSSGPLLAILVPALTSRGFRVSTSRADVCPWLETPATLDEFKATLDGDIRRKFSQAEKAFSGRPGFSVETVRSEAVLRGALNDLIHLHQVRWRRLGSPGLFADARFRSFLQELTPALFSKGHVWLSATRMGGIRTALRMGLRYNGRVYDYLSGFDDSLPGANKRPGYVLFLGMLEDAIRNDCRRIDMLRGNEAYKSEVAQGEDTNVIVHARNPGLASGWRRLWGNIRAMLVFPLHQAHTEAQKLAALAEYSTLLQLPLRYSRLTLRKIMSRLSRSTRTPKTPRPKKTTAPGRDAGLSRKVLTTPLLRKIRMGMERDRDLPLRHVLKKGTVFVKAMVTAPLALRQCTSVGKRSRTRGWPLIDNEGQIHVGDDFNLNSRQIRSELAAGPGGKLRIGNEVSINRGSSLCALDRIDIGNRVRIGPYTLIMDSDFHVVGERHARAATSPVSIGDDVWIGSRVTVLKGSRIGTGSVITAGSVVSGSIPPGVVAGGVPARVIRKLENHHHEGAQDGPENPGRHSSADPRIESRVRKVCSRVFGIPEPVDLSAGPERIPQWDSLGQLSFISAIEEEFGIRLSNDEMIAIVNLRTVCDIVSRHTVPVYSEPD